jgi:hypothetical protein
MVKGVAANLNVTAKQNVSAVYDITDVIGSSVIANICTVDYKSTVSYGATVDNVATIVSCTVNVVVTTGDSISAEQSGSTGYGVIESSCCTESGVAAERSNVAEKRRSIKLNGPCKGAPRNWHRISGQIVGEFYGVRCGSQSGGSAIYPVVKLDDTGLCG